MNRSESKKILFKAAKAYKTNLVGKNFAFVFKVDDKIAYIETAFFPRNFYHLTGVKTHGLSANEFYKMCCREKLSSNDYEFSTDGTTFMKLDVVLQACSLVQTAKMIGDYNNNGIMLYSDKIIGNVFFCLGFVLDESGYYVPNTLLKADIRKLVIHPVSNLLCIFGKSIKDEKYLKIMMTNNNINTSDIILPDTLNSLLSNDIRVCFKNNSTIENVP